MNLQHACAVFALVCGLGCSSSPSGTDGGIEGGSQAVSCTTYCGAVIANCGASDGGANNQTQFTDMQSCMNACGVLEKGTYGDTNNTVGCRQAKAAAAMTDKSQCEAAGMTGGGVCGSRCEDYCNYVDLHCTKANGEMFPPYGGSASTCMSVCAKFTYDTAKQDYDQGATGHLNCLDYHLRESFRTGSGEGIAGGHCEDLTVPLTKGRGACNP
jgi:hypothetical protein